MRRKFTVYGLRFFKTSFWNRINTGFPDPAVATVLTVYGIETKNKKERNCRGLDGNVATVLTVYGIETNKPKQTPSNKPVATVLTVYGIETQLKLVRLLFAITSCNSTYRLRY